MPTCWKASKISLATAERRWTFAHTWRFGEFNDGGKSANP
jgi:hypothetical protein